MLPGVAAVHHVASSTVTCQVTLTIHGSVPGPGSCTRAWQLNNLSLLVRKVAQVVTHLDAQQQLAQGDGRTPPLVLRAPA